MKLVKDASLMFRKNTWPSVRVTEVELAFHSFGCRAPHAARCLAAGTHRGAAPRREVRMAVEAEDGAAIRRRSGTPGVCLITLEKEPNRICLFSLGAAHLRASSCSDPSSWSR
jgi:hypothetical protein